MNIGGQYTNESGTSFDIVISDSFPITAESTSYDLKVEAKGHKLKWRGGEDPYSPLKGSSCQVTFYVEDGTDEANLLTPYTTPNAQYYMTVWDTGGTNLLWWGYVTPELASIKSEGYPKAITIEAVDTLSNSKDYKVWQDGLVPSNIWRTTRRFVTGGTPGSTAATEGEWTQSRVFVGKTTPLPRVGFGTIRNYPSGTTVGIYNPTPSVVECVWGLLFDRDFDPYQELYVVEYYDFNEYTTPTPSVSGGLANTIVDIEPYLYSDYPNNQTVNDVTAYEMLDHICTLFNCRLFMYDGRYYLVQNEIYQDTNTVEFYSYQQNGTAGVVQNPIDRNNGTLTSSGYKMTVYGTGASYPRIADADYERDVQLRKVELNHLEGWRGNTLNQVVTSVTLDPANVAIVNTTSSSNPVEGVPSAGLMKFAQHSVFTLVNVPNGAGGLTVGESTNCFRENSSGTVDNGDIHHFCALARLEARRGINDILNCTLIDDGSYNPFKAITYDSKDWIWTELSYEGNMDEWKGRFIEMDRDDTSTGISEVITQAVQ